MTRPKRWTGGHDDEPKQTTRKRQPDTLKPSSTPKPLMQPVEPIPDEIEVLDEQTTIGST